MDEKRKVLVLALALALVICSIAGVTVLIACMIPEVPEIPECELGDERISLNYTADAKLLSPEPEEEGGGIEIMAESTLFSDNFESGNLNEWDSHSSWAKVTSALAYEGDYSCRLDIHGSSIEWIEKEDAIALEEDCPLTLEFAVYLTCDFQVGTYFLPPQSDYFIAKIKFDNDKTLTYLVGGMYYGDAGEAVIDVRHLLEGTNEWTAFVIDNIQEDYYVHFEEEMPTNADLVFKCKSMHGEAYVDAVSFSQECDGGEEPTRHYWSYDSGEVTAYFVDVIYNIQINDEINESTVWMEIKLWVTVLNEDNDSVQDEDLIQDAVIAVDTFDEDVNWTSKVFDLPEDNEEGDELTYSFDIYVEVVGQINNSTILAGDHEKRTAFDSFVITWTSGDIIILSWVGIVAGIVGTVGIVLGIRSKRLKTKAVKRMCGCDPKKDPNCKCEF